MRNKVTTNESNTCAILWIYQQTRYLNRICWEMWCRNTSKGPLTRHEIIYLTFFFVLLVKLSEKRFKLIWTIKHSCLGTNWKFGLKKGNRQKNWLYAMMLFFVTGGKWLVLGWLVKGKLHVLLLVCWKTIINYQGSNILIRVF